MFGAGALVSQLLAGWLADKFGRRVTLTGGMLATRLFGTALLGRSAATLWLTCAGVALLAAVGQVLLGPAIRRRTAVFVVEPV